MDLHDEFFSIIEAFEENDITYVVIGGIALAFHDKPRFTKDIVSIREARPALKYILMPQY
jgi:hypothetical protein